MYIYLNLYIDIYVYIYVYSFKTGQHRLFKISTVYGNKVQYHSHSPRILKFQAVKSLMVSTFTMWALQYLCKEIWKRSQHLFSTKIIICQKGCFKDSTSAKQISRINIFGPVYLDLSVWIPLSRPISLETSFWIWLLGPVNLSPSI